MDLGEQIVLQLVQPSFYYSTAAMLIALAMSGLLVRINSSLGPRWKSVLLVAPMAAAMFALVIFPPAAYLPAQGEATLLPAPPQLVDGPSSGTAYLPAIGAVPSVVSVTGLVIIAGLVLGVLSALISLAFAGRLTKRLLQVVDLGREDFPELTADIEEIATRLGIPVPSLGLVEDLRPNAFTFGTGRRATVVFSLGMLDFLSRSELKAVAAHELSHVKNRDMWFKASTRALTWAFFFNPAAHLSARAAHRERERLADETARSVLEEKTSLIRAIEKVTRICAQETSRPTLASRIGLGLSLSLVEQRSLMSDHPSLADRARHLSGERLGRSFTHRTCLALSLVVIMAGVVLAMNMGEVRADIVNSVIAHPGPASLQAVGPHIMGLEMPGHGPAPTLPAHGYVEHPRMSSVSGPDFDFNSSYYRMQ